jgi:hypothetical protein
MNINWEGPLITINPKHGTDLQFQGNPPKGIKVPNYGNFGGPLISGEGGGPVDSLDKLFKEHDAKILEANAGGLTPQELVQAHAVLFEGIDDLPIKNGLLLGDPEATLYAGFTLFALTASVMQLDELDGPNDLLDQFDAQLQLAPGDTARLDDVSAALTKAAQYMEIGLEAVPSNESKGLNGLFHIWEHQFDTLIA